MKKVKSFFQGQNTNIDEEDEDETQNSSTTRNPRGPRKSPSSVIGVIAKTNGSTKNNEAIPQNSRKWPFSYF